MVKRFTLYLAVVMANMFGGIVSPTYSTPMGITEGPDFELKVLNEVGAIKAINFDSQAAGTVITSGDSVEGIVFNYDFDGVEMIIADGFDTTSPPNFLGTNDGGVFQDGDSFDLIFGDPINALGLFVISLDELVDGDITLAVDDETIASLDASAVQSRLPDGSQVFFLGVVDSVNSFSEVSLTADGGPGGPFFLYNVDNILVSRVPEPSTVVMFLIGLVVAAFWRRYGSLRGLYVTASED